MRDVAKDTDDPDLAETDEFSEFEKLARKLVAVPKSEIDVKERFERNGKNGSA